MGKKKKGGARSMRGTDWLRGIEPSEDCLISGSLKVTDFDEIVSQFVEVELDSLREEGAVQTKLVGVDSRWRPVVVVEGPEGRPPKWIREDGKTSVVVSGPLMDNLHLVRQAFDRLGVDAAVLAGESWQGVASAEADGLSSGAHRAQAFGRAEAVIVVAYYPAADYRRFVVAPMVRLGNSVTACVISDTGNPDSEISTDRSMLEPCFSPRKRVLGV